jgi:hypothetical protein
VPEVKEKEEMRGAEETEIEEVKGEHVAVTESQQVRAALEGQKAQEVRVDSHVLVLHHAARSSTPDALTREVFEDALDKVSRPLKGRFAHVPYSSDDLIRDKRADVELEDRQP